MSHLNSSADLSAPKPLDAATSMAIAQRIGAAVKWPRCSPEERSLSEARSILCLLRDAAIEHAPLLERIDAQLAAHKEYRREKHAEVLEFWSSAMTCHATTPEEKALAKKHLQRIAAIDETDVAFWDASLDAFTVLPNMFRE